MKLTKRTAIGILPDASRDHFVWDDEVSGFGLRIKPSGVRNGSFASFWSALAPVRYYPQSDRDCDRPNGRFVPLSDMQNKMKDRLVAVNQPLPGSCVPHTTPVGNSVALR